MTPGVCGAQQVPHDQQPQETRCCSTASLRAGPGRGHGPRASPAPPQAQTWLSARGRHSVPPGQLLSSFQAGCDGAAAYQRGPPRGPSPRPCSSAASGAKSAGHCQGRGGSGGVGAGRAPADRNPGGPLHLSAGSQRLATSSGEPLTQASGWAAPGQALPRSCAAARADPWEGAAEDADRRRAPAGPEGR